MVKYIVVIALVGLLVNTAHSLNCYDNTEDNKEAKSKECPKETTTTTAGSTTTSSTPSSTATPDKSPSTATPSTTKTDDNSGGSNGESPEDDKSKSYLLAKRFAVYDNKDANKCFYLKNGDKVTQGCTTKTSCNELDPSTECKICDEDDCNSGAFSLASWTFLTAVFLVLTRLY